MRFVGTLVVVALVGCGRVGFDPGGNLIADADPDAIEGVDASDPGSIDGPSCAALDATCGPLRTASLLREPRGRGRYVPSLA